MKGTKTSKIPTFIGVQMLIFKYLNLQKKQTLVPCHENPVTKRSTQFEEK
jgi:hypothetical protein